MNKKFFLVLLPLASAFAADPPPTEAAQDVTVNDLAHYFLSTPGSVDRIKGSVISEDGAKKLKEASAVHWRDVHGANELAVATRQLCRDLQSARNGTEFATALVKSDKSERERVRQASKRTLAELNPQDRQELENWLNTEFRRGVRAGGLGPHTSESFASGPFPSESTEGVTREACTAAVEYEKRAKP